jgi:Domain of unknown function (DUF222)
MYMPNKKVHAPSHQERKAFKSQESKSHKSKSHKSKSHKSKSHKSKSHKSKSHVPEACVIADLDLLEKLRDSETQRNRLYLDQARILREIAGPHRISHMVTIGADPESHSHSSSRTITIDDGIREQVAVHVRWSFTEAQRRIDHARLLFGPLSHTAQALHIGSISVEHATILCNAASKLSCAWRTSPEEQQQFMSDCLQLESIVLPIAKENTVSRTKGAADKALESIDSVAQRERRRLQRRHHDITIIDEGDGQALFLARMGILEAHACASVIRTHAASEKFSQLTDLQGEALSAGQNRISAFIDLMTNPQIIGKAVQAQLDVVIDLETLLGLQEAMGSCAEGSRAPFPVAGSEIRDFLSQVDCDVTFRRLVTDPIRGHILDVGRTRYTPGAELKRFIQARDISCRFPGCNRSAKAGQIDHAREWGRGGQTNRANLGALCTRHHQLKTHGGWSIVESNANGSCTWRAPHSGTYWTPPRSQDPNLLRPAEPRPEPERPEPERPEPERPEPERPDNSDPPF